MVVIRQESEGEPQVDFVSVITFSLTQLLTHYILSHPLEAHYVELVLYCEVVNVFVNTLELFTCNILSD